MFWPLLTIFGNLALASVIIICLQISLHILRRYGPMAPIPYDLLERYGGGWACVTGASSGIGREFALKAAAKGFNLVLISRSRGALENVASEARDRYGVETKVIPADLSTLTEETVKQLARNIFTDCDVGILIAFAGMSDVNYHFTDEDLTRTRDMVALNCLSLTLLVHAFVPRFALRNSRSAVITPGALNGQIPLPMHSLSSATKAFVRMFTIAVGMTYDAHIDFCCAHPFAVTSGIVRTEADGVFIIEPSTFCDGVFRHLGHFRETFGVWFHELFHELLRRVPNEASMYAWYSIIKRMAEVLKRDLAYHDLKQKVLKEARHD